MAGAGKSVRLKSVPKRSESAEAAEMLRRVLDAVDAGELDAESARARTLVRQMEGAALAFELAAGVRS